jgi:hypothetical protein
MRMGLGPEAVMRLTPGMPPATYTSAVKKWLKRCQR